MSQVLANQAAVHHEVHEPYEPLVGHACDLRILQRAVDAPANGALALSYDVVSNARQLLHVRVVRAVIATACVITPILIIIAVNIKFLIAVPIPISTAFTLAVARGHPTAILTPAALITAARVRAVLF